MSSSADSRDNTALDEEQRAAVEAQEPAIAVLAGARSESMNMRAAFLEVVNDALGSLAVLVAAFLVAVAGWERADAVASLLIGARYISG